MTNEQNTSLQKATVAPLEHLLPHNERDECVRAHAEVESRHTLRE